MPNADPTGRRTSPKRGRDFRLWFSCPKSTILEVDHRAKGTEHERGCRRLGSVSIGTRCREMGGRAARAGVRRGGPYTQSMYRRPSISLSGWVGVAVPITDYEMDIVYSEAVASVFDSIQPELGWRLQFFSGEAGRALVAESVGAALAVVGTKEHVGIGRLVSGSGEPLLPQPRAMPGRRSSSPTRPRRGDHRSRARTAQQGGA
jgi:hypothetical protein